MTDEEQVHVEHDCPICRRREEAELARLKASQNKWVQRCSVVAECMNRLRIIPRVIVLAYGWVFWIVLSWFMSLPERTTADALALSAVTGVAGMIVSFYCTTGSTGSKK